MDSYQVIKKHKEAFKARIEELNLQEILSIEYIYGGFVMTGKNENGTKEVLFSIRAFEHGAAFINEKFYSLNKSIKTFNLMSSFAFDKQVIFMLKKEMSNEI